MSRGSLPHVILPKSSSDDFGKIVLVTWWDRSISTNIAMLYVKIDVKDTETIWNTNTSYHEICMSGAPQAPLRGLRVPGGPKKL